MAREADIVPLRPRRPGDADALWRAYCRLRDELEADVANGHRDPDLVCRVADAYRAWCRAAAWDRIA